MMDARRTPAAASGARQPSIRPDAEEVGNLRRQLEDAQSQLGEYRLRIATLERLQEQVRGEAAFNQQQRKLYAEDLRRILATPWLLQS